MVIGAGGHGRVVAEAAAGFYDTIAFLDDAPATTVIDGCSVRGKFADLSLLAGEYESAIVAVGDNKLRIELLNRASESGFDLISVIHPSAVVSRFAEVGRGCAVLAHGFIGPGATLGAACIVNNAATVDHDCKLGDGVHVSPGANVAGGARIGSRSWIGIGAAVREGVEIGKDVMVGAGAAVVTDIPDNSMVVGVPARENG